MTRAEEELAAQNKPLLYFMLENYNLIDCCLNSENFISWKEWKPCGYQIQLNILQERHIYVIYILLTTIGMNNCDCTAELHDRLKELNQQLADLHERRISKEMEISILDNSTEKVRPR